jgi:hypothetical protein
MPADAVLSDALKGTENNKIPIQKKRLIIRLFMAYPFAYPENAIDPAVNLRALAIVPLEG